MTQVENMSERFADIQMLRYSLPGFQELSTRQKAYIYYLSEATLWGRDITFDQFGRYNLLIRRTLEAVFQVYQQHDDETKNSADYQAFEEYLKRVWFSNGIYHHYGSEKFQPGFSQSFFENAVRQVPADKLPMPADELLKVITPVIFDPDVLPQRVNRTPGDDLVLTSACNYYQDGVTQAEVETFYKEKQQSQPEANAADNGGAPSWGLNSTLCRNEDGTLREDVWYLKGKYGPYIEKIIGNLEKAKQYAENEQQERVIDLLIDYYTTGDLHTFDVYSIEWLKETEGRVDFINGFIEVYGDPLGYKASWEGIVEYKDPVATRRTQTISGNAQWFEDHSPIDPRFRKPRVTGVVANAICAAMIGGDEYPSTAIGINLPNADWIRARYGSKSITITNFTHAYDEASKKSGFLEEFVCDDATLQIIRQYGSLCDELHTDLHECLGHGSGQLLPGVSSDALKEYGNVIEEARADLFGLYYIADAKLVELGLLPDGEAYKSNYYSYILNGMMTQGVRIKQGNDLQEAHMRNRALIANWCYENAPVGTMELVKRDGKTYLLIYDYVALRQLFARLLFEIQRIKSEGDYAAARDIVERYGVKLNKELHAEVLKRYETLNIAPYKGFLNPRMTPVMDKDGNVEDVLLDFSESLAEQMMRYSRDYSLPAIR
ncbi:MAG: dihydrofolate reductase [Prevotella sp.]|nr:dihydrofolate reductase [Prevotella sp.]